MSQRDLPIRLPSLMAALALLGPSAHATAPAVPAPIATVQDQPISARLVQQAAARLTQQGLEPGAAKEQALDALIARKLMVVEAEAQGIWQDERRQRTWKVLDGDLLERALEEDLVQDLSVTDEEIAQFLEASALVSVVRECVASDSLTAATVADSARGGHDLAQLVTRHSVDPGAPYSGGLSPPLTHSGLAMSPYAFVLQHRPGDIIGPMRIGEHYVVLRIEETRPSNAPGLTEDKMREVIVNHKRKQALHEFLEAMKAKHHYTFNAPAASRIAQSVQEFWHLHLQEVERIKAAGGVPPTGGSIPVLEPRDGGDEWGLPDSLRAAYLYKHDKGGRTVGLYVDRMAQVPVDLITPSMNPNKIATFCEEFFKDEVYPDEAKARGLDVKIDYEATRERRYDEFMVNALYQQAIIPEINPDRETLRGYWEAHQDQFPMREVIIAHQVCGSKPGLLIKLHRQLEQGETFDASLNLLQSEAGDSWVVSRDLEARQGQGWRGTHLAQTPVGGVVAAENPSGNDCVLYVQERRAGEPNFAEQYEDVLDHYRAHNDEPYVKALLDTLKQRYTVEVFEDRLAALSLDE